MSTILETKYNPQVHSKCKGPLQDCGKDASVYCSSTSCQHGTWCADCARDLHQLQGFQHHILYYKHTENMTCPFSRLSHCKSEIEVSCDTCEEGLRFCKQCYNKFHRTHSTPHTPKDLLLKDIFYNEKTTATTTVDPLASTTVNSSKEKVPTTSVRGIPPPPHLRDSPKIIHKHTECGPRNTNEFDEGCTDHNRHVASHETRLQNLHDGHFQSNSLSVQYQNEKSWTRIHSESPNVSPDLQRTLQAPQLVTEKEGSPFTLPTLLPEGPNAAGASLLLKGTSQPSLSLADIQAATNPLLFKAQEKAQLRSIEAKARNNEEKQQSSRKKLKQ